MSVTKVIVLYGGISTEHEVSVHSAQTVCRVLSTQTKKYLIYPIFITKQGRWVLQEQCGVSSPKDIPVTPVLSSEETFRSLSGNLSVKADVVFPVLHGTNGEDGTIQGFLETLQIPYVGCGVLSSAVGMDKDLTKQLALAAGVPVVPYKKISSSTYDTDDLESWAEKQGYPLFVKPVRLGSSVGISKVTNAEQLHPAISFALQFDTEVLVEKGVVPARELFCGVYQGETGDIQVSACGELSQSSGEFFDYKAKYITVGGCNMYIPADIPPQTAARMQHDTKAVFVALQGSGLARVDFLMDDKGNYYFSEINTLPGLSETSLWPQLFEACGKKYIDLLDGLICTARQVYARKKSLTVSRL